MNRLVFERSFREFYQTICTMQKEMMEHQGDEPTYQHLESQLQTLLLKFTPIMGQFMDLYDLKSEEKEFFEALLFQRKVHKNIIYALYCKLDPEIGQSTLGVYQHTGKNELDSSIIPEVSVIEALMKPIRYMIEDKVGPETSSPVLVIWHIAFEKSFMEPLIHEEGQSFLMFFNRRKEFFYQAKNPISDSMSPEEALELVLKQKKGNEDQEKMPKFSTNAYRDKNQDIYLFYWGEEALYLISLPNQEIETHRHEFLLTTEYPAPVLFLKPNHVEKFRYEI